MNTKERDFHIILLSQLFFLRNQINHKGTEDTEERNEHKRERLSYFFAKSTIFFKKLN